MPMGESPPPHLTAHRFGLALQNRSNQYTHRDGHAMQFLRKFLREEDGPTAVEYAVLLALIIAACITAIGGLGNSARMMWNDNTTQLNSAW
jgi:pilus assembly protein Flp/PilA